MNDTLALFELHYERIWKKFWPTWSASLADFFLTSQYFIFSATGCKKLNTITRLQIILSISRSFVRSETRPDLTRKQSGRTKKIPSERTKSRIQQNNLFNCFTLLGALPWTPDKTFDIFLTSWDVWCLASGQSQRRKSCNKAPPNNKFIPALRKRENSGEGKVRRRKVLHFLNQGYHFREAYAGDKTQLLATRALTRFKHSCTLAWRRRWYDQFMGRFKWLFFWRNAEKCQRSRRTGL